MAPDAFASPFAQYRDLRHKALAGALATQDFAAYVDARRGASSAVLSMQTSVAGKAKRRAPRAHVRLPITLHFGEWETDTFVYDLSPGGCALYLSEPPSDAVFRFTLQLRKEVMVRGVARVVATNWLGSRYQVSLSFSGISCEGNAVLEDIVLDAVVGA